MQVTRKCRILSSSGFTLSPRNLSLPQLNSNCKTSMDTRHVDYSKIEVDRVFWLKFSEPGEGGVAQPLDTFRRNVYCMCKGNGAIVKLPKNNERILRVAKQQQPSSDIMACAGNPAIRAEDQNGYFFDVTFELVQYLQSREGKDAGGKVVRFIDRNAKPLQDLKYYFDQNKSVPRYPPE